MGGHMHAHRVRLCAALAFVVATSWCLSAAQAQDSDFPELMDDWEAVLEAKIANGSYSFYRIEKYAKSRDRIRYDWGESNVDEQTTIYFADKDVKYRITKNATFPTGVCVEQPLLDWEVNFFTEEGHLKNTAGLLSYDPELEEKVVMDAHYVRGMPCDVWKRDVSFNVGGVDKSFTLYHHFVEDDWTVYDDRIANATTPRTLARISVVHNDTGDTDYYDYINYRSYTYNAEDFMPCRVASVGCGCEDPFFMTEEDKAAMQIGAPSMPPIFTDWASVIEGVYEGQGFSYSRYEIYSPSIGKMKMIWGTYDQRHVLIDDFANNVTYRLVRNATYPGGFCYLDPVYSEKTFYVDQGHMRSTAEVLGLGTEGSYLGGNFEVRGMPVHVWEHHMEWNNTKYVLYHHFVKDEWDIRSDRDTSLSSELTHQPLARIVIRPENDTSDPHYYDFVGMKPYVDKHEDFHACDVFDAVQGCGCEDPYNNRKHEANPEGVDFPTIYPDYTTTLSVTYADFNYSSARTETYSEEHKMLRMDFGSSANKQVIIEDLENRVKYRIAKNATYPKGYCYTESYSAFEEQMYFEDGHAKSASHLLGFVPEMHEHGSDMRHSMMSDGAMMMHGEHYVYPDREGEVDHARGIPVDIWVRHGVNWFMNQTADLYHHFAKEDFGMYEYIWKGRDGYDETKVAPLVRTLVHFTETNRMLYYDYVDMKSYSYDAKDFDYCGVFEEVHGCGCTPGETSNDASVPQNPGFPRSLSYFDWMAKIEYVNTADNYISGRSEIHATSKDMSRIEVGFGSVWRETVILDVEMQTAFRIERNSSYPNGYCYKESMGLLRIPPNSEKASTSRAFLITSISRSSMRSISESTTM